MLRRGLLGARPRPAARARGAPVRRGHHRLRRRATRTAALLRRGDEVLEGVVHVQQRYAHAAPFRVLALELTPVRRVADEFRVLNQLL